MKRNKTIVASPCSNCVGCGYCCRKAQCFLSVRLYGNVDICPALIWDKDKHRYWCAICKKSGKLSAKYRKDLSVGEGCCSSLNSDRNNIPSPMVPYIIKNLL